ncbi:MAG: hypothetical protein DRP93_08620 [Candidatus Neomarinimicrobiota bacterium]|nr:MAG: hypothetical protein DRP93_08620 [Candidatus Neomarinimicrobiota bacterium]
MKQIVWRSIFIGLIASIILIFSITHYYINYKDLSQLAIGVILAFGIFYVSYDQWYKMIRDTKDRERLNKVREHVDENYEGLRAINQKIELMEVKLHGNITTY